MNKSIKILIFLLVLILIGIIAVEFSRPKAVNWEPTFNTKHKSPFGLYVFEQEATKLFKNQKITELNETPYNFLEKNYNYEKNEYNISSDFLYISNDFNIDDESLQELLYFVTYGNSVFISSSNFSKRLQDSLYFEMDYYQQPVDNDSLHVQVGSNKSVSMFKEIKNYYFTKYDSINTTILGTEKIGNETYPNFIKIKHKEGFVYLHTQPFVFTNYYLLQKNKYQYVEQLVSNISAKDIKWYIKKNNPNSTQGSILGYILSQPALKWAWFLSLFLVLFFIIFNAKRRQRIIPIQEKLKNTTVDFAKTIGNLYFLEKDHLNIIDKKIIYFLERIRTLYNIDTHKLDDSFVNRLHHKTNKDKTDILKVVACINRCQKLTQATDKDILELNNAIEKLNI